MTFEPYQFVILFFVGIFAGFINVMAGGGSMITMPILHFMGLPDTTTNGTNRIAVFFQNVTATGGYCRQKVAEPKLSFKFALCALPGALIGAYFGTKLEGPWFNYVLAGVMILVLIYMIFSHRRKKQTDQISDDQVLAATPPSRARRFTGYLLMFVVGLYGGFIQAGVGIIIIASLNGTLGMTLVRANIHKVFIIAFYTLVALAVFGLSNDIYWAAGLWLAGGNSIGALIATRVNLKGGDRIVRILLYLVIIAMAGKLIIENF